MKIKIGILKKLVIAEVGSMSPSMSLKGDPDMHLKRALKKHNLADDLNLFDDLQTIFTYSEPRSVKSFRQKYIEMYADPSSDEEQNDLDSLDMEAEHEGVPSLEVFKDVLVGMLKDEKRATRRSSYEF